MSATAIRQPPDSARSINEGLVLAISPRHFEFPRPRSKQAQHSQPLEH